MLNIVKIATIAIFVGQPGSGKTNCVLNLLRKEYLSSFEYVVLVCPTVRWNKTYLDCPFIWKDDSFFVIEPGDQLLKWVEKLSKLLIGKETLFILDDIVADEALDKTRGALYDLAIAVRHRGHSLWLCTQSYTAIPKRFRRLSTMLFVWFLKDQDDTDRIARENSFISNWPEIFEKLQKSLSKHTFAYIRGEKPFGCQFIE